MKITYFTPDLPLEGYDGGSAHNNGTIKALFKLKHNLLVFAKHERGEKFYEKKEFRIIRLPMMGPGILKILLYNFYSIFLAFPAALLFRSDMVFERVRIFGGIFTILCSRVYKKSIFEMNEPILKATLMDGKIKEKSLTYEALKFIFLVAADLATIITITHDSMKQNLQKRNVAMIHYGADPEIFKPSLNSFEIRKRFKLKKGKTLFYSGSFREWHELRKVLEAMEKLVYHDKEIKLLLAGKGPQYNQISEWIESKKLTNNVYLLGNIHYSKMPSYIATSDICLALFNKEYKLFKEAGYFYSPIKVHEYKAAGKPIITTSIGNLKELVKNEKNGILLKNNTVEEITQAIETLIFSENLVKDISKRNRKEIEEKYNWDNVTKNILHEVNIRTGAEYRYLEYKGKLKKSIIVPALNEADGIEETVKRCLAVCNRGDEVIVVDDGSTDNTSEIAKKAGAKVVIHKVNKGKKTALYTGFDSAKNEVVITIDADCTYPPEAISEMMHTLEVEKADIVVGTRFRHLWPKELPSHRVLANKLGALVTSIIVGAIVTDVTTGLRAFKKPLLKELPPIQAKGLDFEAELTSRAITNGKEYREVKIIAEEREGNSTLNFFKHMWLFFRAVIRGKFNF